MTRSFVALLLDEAIRATVSAQIERLRPLSRAVAWVPAPNLHLTLKFLGEETDARLALATEALGEVGAATAPFAITLFGLGAFPGVERRGRPRAPRAAVADRGRSRAPGLRARRPAVASASHHRTRV
jgi:2'-5' RNA ligase